MKLQRKDFAIASLLGVTYAVLLGATSSGVGYVRDEGHYFHAGEAYARWFEALWDDIAVVTLQNGQVVRGAHIGGARGPGSDVRVRTPAGPRTIAAAEVRDVRIEPHPDKARVWTRPFVDGIWRENFEHPVLMKGLFVLSYRVFSERLGWLNMGDAYRLPAWLFAGLLLFLLQLWATELFDRRTALFATLSLATQPHVFFHAHLACFDVPVVTTWVAALYAFWKAQRSTYWAITSGMVLGVAFATKHNAFFVPFIILAYWAASRWRELGWQRDAGGVRRLQLPHVPLAFFAMLFLAPLLYYALWPNLWYDPLQKFGAYLGFHMNHEHYDTPYLGTILKLPPFPIHFPFVMTALTVPELTVLLGAAGWAIVTWWMVPMGWLHRLLRRRGAAAAAEVDPEEARLLALFPARPRRLFATDQIELYLWLACFVPFALIAHPKTPVFGGTKHWMNAMPFFALFAAVAFNFVVRAFARRFPGLRARPNVLFGALAALVLAPSFVAAVRGHPYGTSYHNLFAGGLAGPVKVGNTIQFWGPTLRNVAGWLNQHAERGAGVCHHEANSRSWVVYQRDGILRRDLVGLTGLGRDCRFDRADYYVYQHMQEYQHDEAMTWQEFGTVFPVHVVALDGMLLVSVYKKPVRALPEGAERGDLVYGRAVVGSFVKSGDTWQLGAWRKNGSGRGSCEGSWRAGALERAGAAARPAKDVDEAYRALSEACFGSRLPQ